MQADETQNKIQRQIEYYLSDENLKNDAFFHEQLSKADEGLIPLSLLFNCKKIQSHGAGKEQIQNAIRSSEQLVLSDDGEKFGRRIKRLPKLRTMTLVVLTDENEADVMKNKELTEDENTVLFKPLIIGFTCDQGIYYKNRELEKRFSKELGVDVAYAKSSKKSGVLVINALKADPTVIEGLGDKKTIQIKKFQFSLSKLSDQEVKNWLERNKKDMELALKVKLGVKVFKAQKAEADAKETELGRKVVLGSMEFSSAKALKDYLKLLINMTKNGSRLKEKDEAVLKDLFKYHPTKKELLSNTVEVYVDVHPEYKATRCFFALLEDESKVDVSFHKCLSNLIRQTNE